MMEDRKKVGLLIIVIALLILIIIMVMIIKKTPQSVDGPITTSTPGEILPDSGVPTTTPGDVPRNYQVYDVSKEDPYLVGINDANKLSSSFVERLGSFSNQSDYSNITDLKIFMTSQMRDWADSYVSDLRSQKYSGEYYGITTRTLTTKVLNSGEDSAKIEVITERRETRADAPGDAYQQKITLDLVKNNNEWLVDGAYWEK